MLPGIVLFYSILALMVAIVMILVRGSSLMGAGAQGLSNACENLALIATALGIWLRRRY
jgi:hypothetical protein